MAAGASWELAPNPLRGTLSNNNLTFVKTVGGAAWTCNMRGNVAFDNGVHEWKVSGLGTNVMFGVAPAGADPHAQNYLTFGWYHSPAGGLTANAASLYCQPWGGRPALNGSAFGGLPGVPITSEFMVRLDCDAHTLSFGANGVWWPVAYTNLPEVPLYPSFEVHTGAFTVTRVENDIQEGDTLHPEQVYRDQIRGWQVAPPPVRLRVKVEQAKLLVLGDAGVGKSSFWGTLCSGVRNRTYLPVKPSPQSEHGTRQLLGIPIYGPDDHEIRARGHDCWGWVPQYLGQIPLMLAGRYQEKDRWDMMPNINQGRVVQFKDEMHGIILMISFSQRHDVEHARQIIDSCRLSEVPVTVLMTKCDLADDVKSDLSNFFESRRLQTAQGELAQSLGIDSFHIHLVTAMNRQPPAAALSERVKSRARSICMKAFQACLYATSDFVEAVDLRGLRTNFGSE
eukprot:CAMPEP_0201479366 /NCGR_PEP_ID=MMETSP0151_2-20130828/4064_1 /ASSEMBLY_ACC=CAM_ASM_000257 /TAXON_ID=200890 /ORGANISM="Paramoeba atlantica, Strain 621/1 / CCAP 1560/9" /LENGTH=451 /DNA_ID=CAMNT_0047860821 /DNA_START=85 /DNA_END=1440 /DNA_ORIENTATION=-